MLYSIEELLGLFNESDPPSDLPSFGALGTEQCQRPVSEEATSQLLEAAFSKVSRRQPAFEGSHRQMLNKTGVKAKMSLTGRTVQHTASQGPGVPIKSWGRPKTEIVSFEDIMSDASPAKRPQVAWNPRDLPKDSIPLPVRLWNSDGTKLIAPEVLDNKEEFPSLSSLSSKDKPATVWKALKF